MIEPFNTRASFFAQLNRDLMEQNLLGMLVTTNRERFA